MKNYFPSFPSLLRRTRFFYLFLYLCRLFFENSIFYSSVVEPRRKPSINNSWYHLDGEFVRAYSSSPFYFFSFISGLGDVFYAYKFFIADPRSEQRSFSIVNKRPYFSYPKITKRITTSMRRVPRLFARVGPKLISFLVQNDTHTEKKELKSRYLKNYKVNKNY